ncbi:uncharacterized protein A4U43_C03F14630 [Asparagus officinalis]|uniref:Uncharacterized protein n=1 Tax=Asparagus officinalis TaxID=4686 RepID=A0A5P1FAN0_ASPOF|nr:uncharacterized protein A4U43_C03F14630 [Asparagus officinalis]
MADDKRSTKVKKGMLAVLVGLEEEEGERFVIPIPYLRHPLFKNLLEMSGEVFGYPSSGPLRLSCSVDDFLRLRRLIDRESSQQSRN